MTRDEETANDVVAALCTECQENPWVAMRCECGFYEGRCRGHLTFDGHKGLPFHVEQRMSAHRQRCPSYLRDSIRLPVPLGAGEAIDMRDGLPAFIVEVIEKPLSVAPAPARQLATALRPLLP